MHHQGLAGVDGQRARPERQQRVVARHHDAGWHVDGERRSRLVGQSEVRDARIDARQRVNNIGADQIRIC